MSDLDGAVAKILGSAADAGAECEAWICRRADQNILVDNTGVTQWSSSAASVSAVTVWRDGREGCAVVKGDDPGSSAVDDALSVGAVLPPSERVARQFPTVRSISPAAAGYDEDHPEAVLGRLLALARRSDLDIELGASLEHSQTAFGETGGGYLEQAARLASVQARIAARGCGPAYIARQFIGRTLGDALDAADCALGMGAACTTVEILSGEPVSWDIPVAVLLHGTVAARLLALLAPSLQLDAIQQRRSRLAGRLGEPVAAGQLSVVHDATGALTPVALAFDDEGTPVRITRPIHRGRLDSFLSDVRHAQQAGQTSNGCGWRPAGGGAVTVGPRALLLQWHGPDMPPPASSTEKALEVVHANGMHISNEITGDFSFGAVGVMHDAHGGARNAGAFTVAGNVLELLANVTGAAGSSCFVRRGGAICGSPSLWVTGLTIGR